MVDAGKDAFRNGPAAGPHLEPVAADARRTLTVWIGIPDAWVRFVTVVVVGGLVAAALFRDPLRPGATNAQLTSLAAARVLRFGGTFSGHGILGRGPLEPLAYLVAGHLSSSGVRYVISFLVTTLALVVAFAAAQAAHFTSHVRALAIAAGIGAFVHLTLAGASYSGVLSSELIASSLVAAAWLLAFGPMWDTPHSRRWTSLAIGVLAGLALQTLAGMTLVIIALTVVFALLHEPRHSRPRPLELAFYGAAVAFLTAPLWSAVRGSPSEFWTGWRARGTSLSGGRLGSSWNQLYAYYRARPLALCAVVAFVVLTALIWPGLDRRARCFHAGLLAWLATAWLARLLLDNSSETGLALIAVPTALIGAAFAGHAWRALRLLVLAHREAVAPAPVAAFPMHRVLLPVATALVALYLTGTAGLLDGLGRASRLHSPEVAAAELDRAIAGDASSTRALLDLVSGPGAPILSSASAQTFLDVDRIPASHELEKLGAAPLDLTQFTREVGRSRPRAYVEPANAPVDPNSPLGLSVTGSYELAYPGPHLRVWLTKSVMQSLVSTAGLAPWREALAPLPGSGWRIDANRVRYAPAESRAFDVARLHNEPCFRLAGTLHSNGDEPAQLSFRFEDPSLRRPRTRLTLGALAASGTDARSFEEIRPELAPGPVPFALIVGARSAALVLGDKVAGAVAIPPHALVDVEAISDDVELRDLRIGAPPDGSGCEASS